MPIPTPRKNEKRDAFINRCMSDEKMNEEYSDNSQRFAVCNVQFSEAKGEIKNEESYNDYPDAVSNNAKRGIELNEKVNNKCATQVGKIRAQQLANKEKITVETIKRMYSYLTRAEVYYNEEDLEACGTISYLLWGGLAGKRWAESKLKELGLFNQ
jgi:hypothetical protein